MEQETGRRKELDDILKKYQSKLEKDLNIKKTKTAGTDAVASREYSEFKKQYLPKQLSLYESLCRQSEQLFKIQSDPKKEKELMDAIKTCHLDVTPSGVTSFALLVLLGIILVGATLSFVIGDMFLVFFFALAAAGIYLPLSTLPTYLAASWRMKASNQMVLSIFYVVTYMRHTSNLELAMDFAAEHLSPPLSLDFKKIVWDVQTEKYSSIKEALDIYLEDWKKTNLEFVESFHLIESSLYEGNEERRIDLLNKSLTVMLEETYEKMLHYAQNLKSPITMIHMMGIILPILGLVVLPLVVSFMAGIKWYHIAILYNITLPITLYFVGKNVLSKRPSGYGDTDVTQFNPDAKKLENIIIKSGNSEIVLSSLNVALIIGIIFATIGLSPILIHLLNPNFDFIITTDMTIINQADIGDQTELFSFLGYRIPKDGTIPIGPYGLGATILGVLLPIGMGIGIGLYYKIRSDKLIEIRDKARALEREFASALFQLGNRLGDGIPAELAFSKVASVMEGSPSGDFFRLVEANIRKLGVDVERAIFDPKYGAITSFPSALIQSSMKVLAQSVKKGPRIAAQAMINVSSYIKEMHKVDERLKDLMSDIVSDMKSQISFLTPAIAGIVIGITSMITTIIGKLSKTMGTMSSGAGGGANMISLFSDGIPTYYFQLIVGIYVVQVIYILSILANGIENGADKLNEDKMIGDNIIRSTVMYGIIAIIIMIIFNMIAGTIVSGIGQ